MIAPASFVRKLETRMVEKVWGRDRLPAPFTAPSGKRIGEIWFEPPPELRQLLVKYLFTSEKLSVQVHPSDAQALAHENGKEECWLVIDAEPGAQLAIGFEREMSGAEIRAAALDGTIEQKLTWHDAKAGDVFYLPAGTVHAIGPGLSLVELQQASDTTFRLYDYGRPRELHVDRATAVASGQPYPARNRTSVDASGSTLVSREHFRLDRIAAAPNEATQAAFDDISLALPLSGVISWGRDNYASAGDCVLMSNIDALDFSEAEITLLVRPNRA